MTTSSCTDSITVLTSRGPLLTKRWLADGTIEGHGQAKQHTLDRYPINSIFDLADVLGSLAARPTCCVVRGEYIGHAAAVLVPDPENQRKGQFILRQAVYFTDPPHKWIMLDVDKYEPVMVDPDEDPVEAIREWIQFNLPKEFWEITFYWQLSSSAGHPSKKGTLRAHLWFCMTRPMTSPEARAWVTLSKVPVDRAPMNMVQAHYVADPVMAEGVVDPLPVRGGLCPGLFGDEVDLQVNEGALAVALLNDRNLGGGDRDGLGYQDPREKKGLIGAFCRAFGIEDVLMAEWFPGNFIQVTDRRYTWLDGNGAAEGVFVNDEGTHLTNTHNSAPQDTINIPVNSYDLVRLYKFGALDDAVPEEDRWSWVNPMDRPSDEAMRKWAGKLPEVRSEMDMGSTHDNPFALAAAEEAAEAASPAPVDTMDDLLGFKSGVIPGSVAGADDFPAVVDTEVAPAAKQAPQVDRRGTEMAKKVVQRLRRMGLTEDETKRLLDGRALKASWDGCFYRAENRSIYLLNKDGTLVLFPMTTAPAMLASTFGKLLAPDVLDAVSTRLAAETSTNKDEVTKELMKAAWEPFAHFAMLHRQRSELRFEVDIFAERSLVSMEADRAAVVYSHVPFPMALVDDLSQEVQDAILAEYRAFFPNFDDLLRLLLAARFASDRRQAFLWMHAPASWGKGFLLDGVLGRDGLKMICEASVKDIERAFEGQPVGISISELVRSWVLSIDEFKSAKGELKMLNSRLIAAPKNQMRATIPLYTKLFTSAEGVGSLAGDEGVETQFAERFSLFEAAEGDSINNLPLFQLHGKAAYRRVIANATATMLNRGVDDMRAIGRHAATRQADVWLAEFHTKHGIANVYGDLADSIGPMAAEVQQLILDWAARQSGLPTRSGLDSLKRDLKDTLGASISTFIGSKYSGEEAGLMISASRLVGVVRAWIDATYDRSQRPMYAHKAAAVAEKIAGTSLRNPVRHYVMQESGTTRAVKIKGGAVLVLQTPEEYAARNAEFPEAEKKVVDINTRRNA